MRERTILLAALLLSRAPLSAQSYPIRPGPPDVAVPATHEQEACLDSLLVPYIAQGQATYQEAKARYIAGLPPHHRFLVSAMLFDSVGHREMVFIHVLGAVSDTVYGRLDTDVLVVQGFRQGDRMRVLDSAVLDWTIARPDGTEEGNAVGTFIDTLHGHLPC